jgi:hypothetical protein
LGGCPKAGQSWYQEDTSLLYTLAYTIAQNVLHICTLPSKCQQSILCNSPCLPLQTSGSSLAGSCRPACSSQSGGSCNCKQSLWLQSRGLAQGGRSRLEEEGRLQSNWSGLKKAFDMTLSSAFKICSDCMLCFIVGLMWLHR